MDLLTSADRTGAGWTYWADVRGSWDFFPSIIIFIVILKLFDLLPGRSEVSASQAAKAR